MRDWTGEAMNTPDARVLVLTELFQPTKGGTAVWFDEVYRRMGGAGTHILTADVPGAEEHDRASPNTIHRLGLKRSPWLRPESLPVYLEFFLKTLSVGWRHPVTQIHAGRVLPEGLVAVRAGRLLRLPVVIYAHGEEITTWRQPRRVKAMREAYCDAQLVIANSEFTRGLLLDMGVQPERVVIINPGVDTERFRPGLDGSKLRASLGLKPEAKLILSVGRLSRRKGFDYVMQSVPELVRRGLDVHHAVIGKGEDADYLAGIRAASEMPERIHLLVNPSEHSPEACGAVTPLPETAFSPAAAPEAQPRPEAIAAAPVTAAPAVKATRPAESAPASGPAAEDTLRVHVGLLETLMNLAGELVLSRNQLRAAVAQDNRTLLAAVDQRVNQVTSELQDVIMQTRLQPVGNVFSKFPRVVRDLSRALGKEIELDIRGKDVAMDKTMIEIGRAHV